jgi:hypothetical protein
VTKAGRRLAATTKAASTDVTREKLTGARAALRDADGEIGPFAAEHYAELRDAVNAEAGAAAAEWTPRSWTWRPPIASANCWPLARDAEAATMREPEVAPALPESFLPAEAEQPMIEPMAETFS